MELLKLIQVQLTLWFDKDGRIKNEYWDKYYEEYNIDAGGFWDKLKEYEKDNDVYLKGN